MGHLFRLCELKSRQEQFCFTCQKKGRTYLFRTSSSRKSPVVARMKHVESRPWTDTVTVAAVKSEPDDGNPTAATEEFKLPNEFGTFGFVAEVPGPDGSGNRHEEFNWRHSSRDEVRSLTGWEDAKAGWCLVRGITSRDIVAVFCKFTAGPFWSSRIARLQFLQENEVERFGERWAVMAYVSLISLIEWDWHVGDWLHPPDRSWSPPQPPAPNHAMNRPMK
ncbi:hypothetical protein B0H63DRAFT_468118 [Podospora didyma]|uniref:Uncharacterized protein n=1 Tax=Podospora didyma TaxID=330526 RepID=A0AAE0NRY0_9PEZI|nr:hypothetical protein B0H63DRAFT_468118 [Podospora didyma]